MIAAPRHGRNPANGSTVMEKKLRAELLKMSVIMTVLVGLGIYAHEFVIDGIKA